MARVKLGPADLPEGGMQGFDLGGRFVLVARFAGVCYAISDWCNHAGCLLSRGELEGRFVTCPCHGATFDVGTGKNVNAPHLCGDQDRYPLCVEDGQLVLELDD
jgi:3-phenylpropionate/trans-cinnamate dioxygenase ferredoxin subunit